MSLFRRHGRERRGETDVRYRMRQELFTIGDDYWIENDRGDRVFRVDGKALRVRDTAIIEGLDGIELCKVQQKKLRVHDTMEIERDEHVLATVKKAIIAPLRQRYSVDVRDGDDLEVHGNIVDHEYAIKRDGQKIAEVSKRWFRIRDTYGVEISPGQDDALVLAVAVCLDRLSRD